MELAGEGLGESLKSQDRATKLQMEQKEHVDEHKYSSNLGDAASVEEDSRCILLLES